ncbi:MAG: Na+/H+ antiporter subunit D [Phyllobacteriaceae bacterium]|nr:Na+/H+ antiporter subunit D [Nitratireductor sp.]MCO5133873.1 Na+/H+ antiporter subunit D [Phyllobacteriaceae bacterium]
MAGSTGETIDLTGIMVEAGLQPADYLVVAPVVIPILFGALHLMLRNRPVKHGVLAIIGMGLLVVCTFGLLQRVLDTGPVTMTMGRWLPPFGISFSVDTAGALLAFTSAVIALGGAVYAAATSTALESRYGFYPFFMLMMAGVSGAFLTGDVFNLYVWFEVLLISSFGMIVLGSEQRQLDGTMKYAFLNLVATTMFLVATGLLYGTLGTLNMADIWLKLNGEEAVQGPVMTIAMLYFLAFAMKAAAFPLNFWLPASYHTPKYLVSALFAGLLTKVGVYALLRISLMLFADQREVLALFIAWVAALTMLVGVLGALAQREVRRVLGYLVISGIGTMLAGLAIGTQTAVAGVLVYAVHSMIVMAALYLAAGIMARLSGTADMAGSGGLYAASPMLAGAFLILAFSVSGLPPTSGFWGKFVLVKSALEVGAWWLAFMILFSGLLTTIAVFRIWIFAFWRGGPEGTPDGAEAWTVNRLDEKFRLHSALTLGVLTLLTLGLGLAPEMLLSAAADGARGLLYPLSYVGSAFGGGGQ